MKKTFVYPLLILTFVLWASNYVGGKYLSDDLPPVLIACIRMLIAAVVLGVVSHIRNRDVKVRGEDRKYFLLCGFTGYFGTMLLMQIAMALTGASTASLINSTTPVAVTLLAAFMLHEKITPVTILCLVLAASGAVVLTVGADNTGRLSGMAFAIGAVLCWSVTSVFIRKLTAVYPPLKVTADCMLISMLFHIPAGIFAAVRTGGVRFEAKHLVILLYLGLMASALAQFTWSTALSVLPASTCSLFYPTQPVFSAVMGYFLLGERFKANFVIALVLIAADVVLSTWDMNRKKEK